MASYFARAAGCGPRAAATALCRAAHLDTAPGAPVSDPAGIQKHPETRRIGDQRSAVPFESGAVSRCGTLPRRVAEPSPAWWRPSLPGGTVLIGK